MKLTTNNPQIIVIDNFYQDPQAVKQMALDSEYHQPGMRGDKKQNFSGSLSLQNYHPTGISQYMSRLLGKDVRSIPKVDHGYFRCAVPEDKPTTFVHCDAEFNAQGISKVDYSLVIYLNESAPEPDKNGTIFFKHKQTQSNRATLKNGLLTAPDLDKPDQWEIESVVGFRWNRAVLFEAAMFHTAGAGFGSTKQDARCVQVFYFHNFENP